MDLNRRFGDAWTHYDVGVDEENSKAGESRREAKDLSSVVAEYDWTQQRFADVVCETARKGTDASLTIYSPVRHTIPACLAEESANRSTPILQLSLDSVTLDGFNSLPTTLTLLSVNNSAFAGAPQLDWNAFFARFDSLEQLVLQSSTGIVSLPPYQPRRLYTLRIISCGITGTIPSTFFAEIASSSVGISYTDLHDNRLSGTIPATLFQPLKQPQIYGIFFDLSNNALTGSLSESLLAPLAGLRALEIYLYRNRLSGTIPSNLFSPSQISNPYPQNFFLDVSQNRLSGTLPEQLMQPLHRTNSNMSLTLTLSNNRFSGAVPSTWADGFFSCFFYLDYNELTGTVPAKLFQSPSNPYARTIAFVLANNKLNGPLPPALFQSATAMQAALLLSNNPLATDLPSDIFRIGDKFNAKGTTSGAIRLDLTNCSLTGFIPSSIVKLPPGTNSNGISSVSLQLGYNPQLKGSITTETFSTLSWPNLRLNNLAFSAPYCGITGTLPTNFLSTLDAERVNIDLSGNQISGPLDGDTFTLYVPLEEDSQDIAVNLAGNPIGGNIPANLLSKLDGKFVSSFWLRIANAQINGTIPEGLLNTSIPDLQLFFDSNRISGTIPEGIASSANPAATLIALQLSKNQLSGSLPNSFCIKNTSVELRFGLDVSHNAISGDLPPFFFWKCTMKEGYLDISSNDFDGDGIFPIEFLSQGAPALTVMAANNRFERFTNISLLYDASGRPSLLNVSLSNNSLVELPDPQLLAQLKLQYLDLSMNRELTGFLPYSSTPNASLPQLLNLSYCSFYGPLLPYMKLDSWPGVPLVYNLLLAGNQLNGTIPREWQLFANDSSVSGALRIDLTDNIGISGALPPLLGATVGTNSISLLASGTSLSGPVPPINITTMGAIVAKQTQADLRGMKSLDFCSPIGASPRPAWTQIDLFVTCSMQGTNICECASAYPPTCVQFCYPTTFPSESCPPQTRPSQDFVCIDGLWTLDSGFFDPTLVIPNGAGTTVIQGNLDANSVVFQGLGSTLIIDGCANGLGNIVVQLTQSDLDKIKSKPQTQHFVTSNTNDPSCQDLSSVTVVVKTPSKLGCKRINIAKTRDSGRQNLSAVFTLNTSRCNLWWIILIAVIGGILIVAVIIFVLLVAFVPSVRAKIRPFAEARRNRAADPTTVPK